VRGNPIFCLQLFNSARNCHAHSYESHSTIKGSLKRQDEVRLNSLINVTFSVRGANVLGKRGSYYPLVVVGWAPWYARRGNSQFPLNFVSLIVDIQSHPDSTRKFTHHAFRHRAEASLYCSSEKTHTSQG